MKQHAVILGSMLLLAAVGAAAAEPLPAAVSVAAPAQPLPPATQVIPAAIANAGGESAPSNSAPLASAQPTPGLTLADLKAQFPQSKEGHFQMEVPSILNTSTDREAQALLDGQSIETTGQVMAETVASTDGNLLRITRSQLLCCSAHARECSVALIFPDKVPAFKELAWVKLAGTLSYKREGLKSVPVIIVNEIRETAAPKNPLLQ